MPLGTSSRQADRRLRPLPPAEDPRSLRVIPGGREEPEPYEVSYADTGYGRSPLAFRDGPDDDDDEIEEDRATPKRRSTGRRVVLKAVITLTALGLLGVLAINREAIIGPAGAARVADVSPAGDPAAFPAQPAVPAAQPAPVAAAAPLPPVPDVPVLVILIRNAMVALQQANITGNYSVLRELAAPDFQAANSTARLADAFAALRARNVDLAAATVVDPSLNRPPLVDRDGRLHLNGFFDAAGTRIDFDLAYQITDGRWRLFTVGVQPADQPPPAAKDGEEAVRVDSGKPEIPDAAALVTLMRTTVIALNQANLTGNYSVLRDLASPGFQQANSYAKLTTIFADLRGRQIDLGPVAVIDPKLFRPPAIDERGMLRISGFFVSQPEQVNFDLAFQRLEGRWVLFGLGVNTSVEMPVANNAGSATAATSTPAEVAAGESPDAAATPPPAVAAVERAPRNLPPPMPRLRPGEVAQGFALPDSAGSGGPVTAGPPPVAIDPAALQPAGMEPALDPGPEQG